MNNFRDDILKAAGGEEIVGVVISGSRSGYYWEHRDGEKPDYAGKVLPWSEAEKILDYKYDDGYGCQDCHNVYVWTPTRVIGVHEYDGSTTLEWAPRNPIDCEPEGF